MSEQNKSQVPLEDRSTSFIPFGAKEEIKLNILMIINMIAVPTRTGVKPTERDAIKFMMMCQATRSNPWAGDAYMIGFDAKDGAQFAMFTAHQMFLKRAESNPAYDGMQSGVIVLTKATESKPAELLEREGDFHMPDEQLMGGWAFVYKKNVAWPTKARVRLGTFKKEYGQWMNNSNGMICKCAEADALRRAFPTMLAGLYFEEEARSFIDVESTAVAPRFKKLSGTPSGRNELPEPAPQDPILSGAAPERDKVPAEAAAPTEKKRPESKLFGDATKKQAAPIVDKDALVSRLMAALAVEEITIDDFFLWAAKFGHNPGEAKSSLDEFSAEQLTAFIGAAPGMKKAMVSE